MRYGARGIGGGTNGSGTGIGESIEGVSGKRNKDEGERTFFGEIYDILTLAYSPTFRLALGEKIVFTQQTIIRVREYPGAKRSWSSPSLHSTGCASNQTHLQLNVDASRNPDKATGSPRLGGPGSPSLRRRGSWQRSKTQRRGFK